MVLLVGIFGLFVSYFLLLIVVAHAQTNTAAATDAMCRQMCAQAQAKNPPQPCPAPTLIMCGESVGGAVKVICMLTGCKAISAAGLNGGNSMTSLSDLAKTIGQILSQMMSGGGSGGSGKLSSRNAASKASSGTAADGCTASSGMISSPESEGISTSGTV